MRTTRIFLFFGSLLLGACAVTSIQKESTLEDIWKDRAADWRERLKHDEISILLLSGQIPMENNPKISELTKERYVRFISLLKILRDLDGHPFLKALVATQWMQRETRNGFYIRDGQKDYWETPAEVFQKGGDDCDGLASLLYHALRFSGFSNEEIDLKIIRKDLREREDDQVHLVVIWYDKREREFPWVLDPVGSSTQKVLRVNNLGWSPEFSFNEIAP